MGDGGCDYPVEHAGTKEVPQTREHRRLVLQPFGIPVVCFSSKRELISVLIDIVQSKQVTMVTCISLANAKV